MAEDKKDPKPGYKSTEFWLTAVAAILGIVFTAGFAEDSQVLKIAGMAASVLTIMGYQVSRGAAKKGAKVLFMLLVPLILLGGCCVGHVRAKGILSVTTEVSERHDRLLNDEANEDDKDPAQKASHLRSSKLLRTAVTNAASQGDD